MEGKGWALEVFGPEGRGDRGPQAPVKDMEDKGQQKGRGEEDFGG